MIKAIIFDIDGVLLDSGDANCKFFQDLIESSGYARPSKEQASEVFHLTMLDAIRHLTKEKSDEKIKRIWKSGHTFPYPESLVKTPNDSERVIKALKKTYKIAIVTSRIRRGIAMLCKIYNVEESFFDAIVTFEDFKKPKPDPDPLLVAADRLKITPKEAIYVGDQETDRVASERAGMKFIFYSNKPAKNENNSFEKIQKSIKDIA